MSILLTGASGFIGRRVLQVLREKCPMETVFALSSKTIEGTNTIYADKYNFDADYLVQAGCGDVDTLFHIGAWIPHESKVANDIDNATANIKSTLTLLKAKLPRLKKVIFCSSIDVYGDVDDKIDENTPPAPLTLYGWSKIYCEKIVTIHAKEHGLICQILRIGHVYGEGEECYRKAMPVMIENAIRGNKLTIFGDGEAVRSFIYVDDVAHAIVNARNLSDSNLINIVGNTPISINQLADLLNGFSKHSLMIEHIAMSDKNKNFVFDAKRMKDLLNIRLTPFAIGLQREFDYMRGKLLH